MAGLAAVAGEEGLTEGDGLGREVQDLALLEGGGDAASVKVSGDVGGFAGAEVLGGHAAGGPSSEGVAEEGGEGRIAVVVGEGDGGGREGGGFEVGFGR